MMNTVEFYLGKGFDKRTAEYFASGRRKIISVKPEPGYKLFLHFDNDEKKILDMTSSIMPGTVFEFLSDPANFKRVYLDEDSCVSWDINPEIDSRKTWSNKVDLSPDSCYLESIPADC